MSYCRWSSDNWKSDVYVYEDVNGGWTTHVAGNRVVGDVPEEPNILTVPVEEFRAAHKLAMAFLETCERETITLPYAGAHFNDSTAGECAERLKMLREAGYHVPQYAIDELLSEANSAEKQG